MARPDELVPGNVYFVLNFFDEDLFIPSIHTLVFEGTDEFEEGGACWLFRDPDLADTPDGSRLAFDDGQLHEILDLAGLRRGLAQLVPLHPLHPLPVPPAGADAPRAGLPELEPALDKLLASTGVTSLTLTIRYRDLGLSFGRRAVGKPLDASLFIDVHDERQPEDRLRAVFSALGLAPTDDYLSQNGRVRILAYEIPEDRKIIARIAHAVLIDIFG